LQEVHILEDLNFIGSPFISVAFTVFFEAVLDLREILDELIEGFFIQTSHKAQIFGSD